MKILRTIFAACLASTLVGAGSAQTISTASAQQYQAATPYIHIRIAGSTAYRAAVYQAINSMLGGFNYVFAYTTTGTTDPNGQFVPDYGVLQSDQAIFTGIAYPEGIPVIIKTNFSGSVGGIAILAANLTVGDKGKAHGGGGWLVDTTPQSYPAGFPSGGTPVPQFLATPPYAIFDPPASADVVVSDCFQSSAPAPFRSPILHDAIVGVVPFVFVLSPGAAAHGSLNTSTSISSNQIRNILVGGGIKLSELSGNSLDIERVLGVGFDEDGAERVQALACSGIPTGTTLKQFQPLFNGNTQPADPPPLPVFQFNGPPQITGAALWPAVTVDGLSYPTGDSGYAFARTFKFNQLPPPRYGPTVREGFIDEINVSHSGAHYPTYAAWFITCVGLNDAANISNGIQLEFEGKSQFGGVPYSAANVEGPGATGYTAQYALWGYEHLMYRATLTGDAQKVADQIASLLTTTFASNSGILLSSMKVSRDSDGGQIEQGPNPGN